MENQQSQILSPKKLMSVEDLFKNSFALYRPKIFTMLSLVCVGALGSLAMLCLFGAAALLLVWQEVYVAAILVVLIGALLLIMWQLWIQTALIFTLKQQNGPIGIKQLLMDVRQYITSYFWVMFLEGLIIGLGFILFIIPGLIFSIWFCLAEYAFVFEGKKGSVALWRSRELIRGYGWAVLGRVCLLFLITLLVSFIPVVGKLIHALFLMPFSLFYMYSIYEDIKRIKSGPNAPIS